MHRWLRPMQLLRWRDARYSRRTFSRALVCATMAHSSYAHPNHVRLPIIDSPWGLLDGRSTATGYEVLCHLPSRFRSTGQTKLAMME